MSTGASSSLSRYLLLPRTLPDYTKRGHATKAGTGHQGDPVCYG